LAQLHQLSHSYQGPASRYELDLQHLLVRPLAALLTAPGLDAAMQATLVAMGARLEQGVAALGPLTMVTCHGDCHGGNTFVTDAPGNTRLASFFDFDDAGPGCLAYDLAVYLWGMQMDSRESINAAKLAQWQHFLRGYQQVSRIADKDLAAIAAFVPIRHIWLLGERASRVHEWGTQALPAAWLRKQLDWMAAWEALPTPALS
jgi:Ser/Thr protein kinase RdoA (MazF antagonist)